MQPLASRGRLRVTASSHAPLRGSRQRYSPPVSYSVNRRDINGAELGMLLQASRCADMGPGGPPMCRQHYSYWCTEAGVRHASRLELALKRSVATVACFTTAYDMHTLYGSIYGSGVYDGDEEHGHGEGGGGGLVLGEERTGYGRGGSPTGGSPSRGGSPSSFGRSSSPAAYSRPGSPSAFTRSSSPSMYDRGSSPSAYDRGSSPSMYDRSASPASYDRGSSPSLRPGVPDMDWNWLRPSSSPRERGAALWPPSGTAGGHHAGVAAGAGAGSGPGGGGGGRALVGFARATGDNSLVATIYDVAVHPALRGHGIGSRLVKLLVQQVQSRSVYDIGVVTPTSVEGFWSCCAFEDDREGSTMMAFMGRDGGGRAPRSCQELECDSSLVFWDAASRSDSLRGLLQRKLMAAREGGQGGGGAAAGLGGRRGMERWGGARRGRQQQQGYGGRLVGAPASSSSSPSGGAWSSGSSAGWSSSAGRYVGDQGDDLQDWLGQEL